MSATNRSRGAVPTKMAAAIAAMALLAVPAPAGADGSSRTVLLTLNDEVSLSQLSDAVQTMGGRVLQTLEIADSLLVELPAGVAVPAGAAIVPDTPMKVNGTQTYYETTKPTYRKTIRAGRSSLGEGVTVALLDTGVASDADGLGHVEHVNVSGADQGDGLGHGTFLAGIIGGRGKFKGVAPGADLVDVQVADAEGNTSLRKVLSGLDAVSDRGDIDVLNISLSTESPLPPWLDPLSRALERLWADGVTVVTAAGNDGPKRNTVGAPGNDEVLLTVGALDEGATSDRADDSVAEFSSWGGKKSGAKPDLVAPGTSLVSTAAPDSIALGSAAWSEDGYMRGSGTSMSAAVVTGAAAALIDKNARLSPNGIKSLLTETTYDVDDSARAGSGALDMRAALKGAKRAPANPTDRDPAVDDESGPAEEDAQVWADFAAAWEAGDSKAVKAAWKSLTWQTQQWAARSWSIAVMAASLDLSEEDFEARSWSARSWSLDAWLARSWSARSWSARSWSYDKWLARSWSARSWSARSWSARSWSVDKWLARSWSARSWSDSDWAARSWSARSWSARSWSARSWSARSWSARSWSDEEWAARSWSARSWSARSWSARSWSMIA